MRPAQQGLVLCGAIVFWYEDRGAPFAFHLAPDIAHEAIDGEGKAPFVEPLDHNVALVGFHHEGEVLDMLAQRRRDKRATLRLMRKLLRKLGFAPKLLTTDKLGSYGAAFRHLRRVHYGRRG